MKTQLNSNTQALLEDSWRLTPARMAEHLMKGRFQRYSHLRFLENKIAQAIGRGGARLIISMPPLHGKSWLASLFTPAWFLSLWPERNVILTSQDPSIAAAWGRSVRDFLRQHEAMLGAVREDGIITAGVGGSINGHGGHLLVVDDPLKSWKEASSPKIRQAQIDWFNSTLYTRAEPGASIIVIMTRWHERDLAGYLETEHDDEWEVLRVPAISEGKALCEERYGIESLEQIRRGIGSRAWNALYQQEPASDEGNVLKREWWKHYQALPDCFDEVIQSWDMTFKDSATSDYVVGQVWGRRGANKYLIDQVRAKMNFSATIQAVRELSKKYPEAQRKLIEDKANGSAVISTLQDSISGLVVVNPLNSKSVRVNEISAEIESGNVYLPTVSLAPWVEELINECADFPNAKHDDQVDAMAQALKYLRKGELDARTQCSSSANL